MVARGWIVVGGERCTTMMDVLEWFGWIGLGVIGIWYCYK